MAKRTHTTAFALSSPPPLQIPRLLPPNKRGVLKSPPPPLPQLLPILKPLPQRPSSLPPLLLSNLKLVGPIYQYANPDVIKLILTFLSEVDGIHFLGTSKKMCTLAGINKSVLFDLCRQYLNKLPRRCKGSSTRSDGFCYPRFTLPIIKINNNLIPPVLDSYVKENVASYNHTQCQLCKSINIVGDNNYLVILPVTGPIKATLDKLDNFHVPFKKYIKETQIVHKKRLSTWIQLLSLKVLYFWLAMVPILTGDNTIQMEHIYPVEEIKKVGKWKPPFTEAKIKTTWQKWNDTPLCKCGLEAIIKVSHSTKNPDRGYYTCRTSTTEAKCKYFLWVDEAGYKKNNPKFKEGACERCGNFNCMESKCKAVVDYYGNIIPTQDYPGSREGLAYY